VVCGAVIGIHLRHVLPPEHIKDDLRQIVNVATGVVATLAALVLGLIVASANGPFDARADDMGESSARSVVEEAHNANLRDQRTAQGVSRELLPEHNCSSSRAAKGRYGTGGLVH